MADPIILVALVLDLAIGDPPYPYHPIRLLGHGITWFEGRFFSWGGPWSKRLGGIVLVLIMVGLASMVWWLPRLALTHLWWPLPLIWDLFWAYSLLALGDLVHHGAAIAKAVEQGDLDGARKAAGMLVGRDLAPMDLNDCARAGVESLSENLCDGVVAPLFWYGLLGIPGLIVFKVASTLDSMVGYKTERYLYFGWAGARLDDVLNWIPARITWLLIALVAAIHPKLKGWKALETGWRLHKSLPGFNSGWPEMAAAGALGLKLIGPLWRNGTLITDIWLGPPEGTTTCPPQALRHMMTICIAVGIVVAIVSAVIRWAL